MYRCEVCKRSSPPKAAKITYKETVLCERCYRAVKGLELGVKSTAQLVAADVIASFERLPGSPEISWPRS